MSLLVDRYILSEHNRGKLPMCNECTFIPAWEVRTQVAENPTTGYACTEHVDTVLYKTMAGKYSNE